MKLYTYEEAGAAVGKTYAAILQAIKRKKIAVFKKGDRKAVAECDLEKLRATCHLKYYKVSVFDDNLGKFVVKKCSLRKGEAVKLAKELQSAGFIARYSEH